MRSYICSPKYIEERLEPKDADAALALAALWEPVDVSLEGTNGNIAHDLFMDRKTGTFHPGQMFDPKLSEAARKKRASLSEAISSALALYRMLCLWKCAVQSEGPEGYKVVWSVPLKNKLTGEVVAFGEYKGGFQLFSRAHSCADLKCAAQLIDLLNLICGPKCPHPYDGTVAGSVA